MPARGWLEDARHWQIAALGTLLTLNIAWLDFGAKPLNSALAIGAALATPARHPGFRDAPSRAL
jgi:enediyne biosynthesis protein E5